MQARIDHYRLLEWKGRGSIGDTYTAVDEKLGRTVVLKIIDRDRLAADGARRKFINEARSAASLSHPFICGIFDVLESDRQPIVVMEYVEGPTVLERVAGGPMPPREVVWHGREMAEALGAAHARGIIYRDLSAANVKITADGHVKLMDLGLAHLFTVAEASAGPATPRADVVHSRAMLLGTPVYMAPEILNGGPSSTKSDLYALGVVLYLMLTGRLPFAERMSQASLAEMLVHAPVPPGLLVAGIPVSLERAVMRLLEKKPDARFPSAESLAAAL